MPRVIWHLRCAASGNAVSPHEDDQQVEKVKAKDKMEEEFRRVLRRVRRR